MKRIFSIAIITLMVLLAAALPLAALSEAYEDGSAPLVLGASVTAKEQIAVKAPMSGALEPFDVRAGDAFAAGDTLFAVEPQSVYADIDGTVAAIYVEPGDIADAAVARYGAVMQIERAERWEIVANVATGYNSSVNRDPRVGWQVWLRSSNEKRFADGEIIAVNGRSFTVRVIGGDLQFNDDVKIYRTSDYDNKSLLSRANLSAVAAEKIAASGTVLSVAVKPGDTVRNGDLLLTYAPDVLPPERRGASDAREAKADAALIVASLSVQQGASVQKDQTLCLCYRADGFQLVARAEEGDLHRVPVGARATVSFVELDAEPIAATVASVSALGSDGDTATYEVRLDFDAPAEVRLGMHATVEFE